MIFRIMTHDGDFPNRHYGKYYDVFYDYEYAKRCRNAIKRFNKNKILVIEELDENWRVRVE